MTVAEVANWLVHEKRLPVMKATRVTLALCQWAIASDAVGHFVSISEFARWSGEDIRTVERRSSLLRRALTEEELRYLVGELRAGAAPGDARVRVARGA